MYIATIIKSHLNHYICFSGKLVPYPETLTFENVTANRAALSWTLHGANDPQYENVLGYLVILAINDANGTRIEEISQTIYRTSGFYQLDWWYVEEGDKKDL